MTTDKEWAEHKSKCLTAIHRHAMTEAGLELRFDIMRNQFNTALLEAIQRGRESALPSEEAVNKQFHKLATREDKGREMTELTLEKLREAKKLLDKNRSEPEYFYHPDIGWVVYKGKLINLDDSQEARESIEEILADYEEDKRKQ